MVEEKNIAPHVPVWDKSERTDGTFSRSDFIFDAGSNTYTCPGGKTPQQYRRPFTIPWAGVTKNNMRLIAVDTQPASKLFVAAGVDPATIPPNLNIPSGPSWQRLIVWLLSLGENVSTAAIPDVVNLYISWSSGMLGLDPLTRLLLQRLYRSLAEIEAACSTAGPFAFVTSTAESLPVRAIVPPPSLGIEMGEG